MTGAPAVDESGNFRSRAAADRRERMRARLLAALLDLYRPGSAAHLVIDDVIRAANVSRGTFYKYFDSLDAAVAELGEQLTAGMIADFLRVFADEVDPAVRAMGGAAMAIARAWHDPRWASFTCRVDYVDFFARRRAFDLMVRDGLAQSRACGQLDFESLDAAMDVIVGVTVAARQRLIGGIDAPRRYTDEILGHVFIGLGMDADRTAAVRQAAWSRIAAGASALGWWSASRDWPV